MHNRKRVVVAMSGGVDSSVTAALLKEEGYDVVGISMQVWDHSRFEGEEAFGSCCSLDDIQDARRVAEQLDIPFYVVNFEEEFQRLVIDDFVSEYLGGRTPNPCIRCNQLVKFELLLHKAAALDADYLATGHYARIQRGSDGRFHLLTGVDHGKDQSYFLFTLSQQQMGRVLFPLGGMTKQDVRRLAASFSLRVAEKGESQEICFIPDNDYIRFLKDEQGEIDLAGDIVDSLGRVLGRHDGTYRYTVGQRKGLGIAHPHPLYVVRVDPARREVVVGGREDLFAAGLVAGNVYWTVSAPATSIEAACKIRYRHHPVPCLITPLPGGRAEVVFREREKSVTPGQAVVFYQEEEVLGGGWIE